MKRYCIIKRDFRSKLADWPAEAASMYRAMDKARRLEGFSDPRVAQATIPDVLRPFVTVAEYVPL